MAMIDTARPAPFGAITIFHYIGEPIADLITRFRSWTEARRSLDALSKLSPALLEDIGMTPADVHDLRRNASFF